MRKSCSALIVEQFLGLGASERLDAHAGQTFEKAFSECVPKYREESVLSNRTFCDSELMLLQCSVGIFLTLGCGVELIHTIESLEDLACQRHS